MSSFTTARAAIGEVFEIIDRKPLIDGLSDEGIKPSTAATGIISLKDLCFAYPTRPDILVCNQYNLQIEAGETVALVGSSGSGKVIHLHNIFD